MNKADWVLIFFLILIVTCSFYQFYFRQKQGLIATVYRDQEVVLKIDLTKEEQAYIVDGEIGQVHILAGNGKIQVTEETSQYHLCSKQGSIQKVGSSIVCLPNKVLITIEGLADLDATI